MDVVITLDHQSNVPLHRQLYAELRWLILSRRLLPGQKLPSTRAFAQSLAISRATVTLSYEQLLSEGYLHAVQGSGTFVCTHLPDELLKASVDGMIAPSHLAQSSIRLSNYGNHLLETDRLSPQLSAQMPISFQFSTPDLESFPLNQWRQLLARHCRTINPAWLDYTNSLGYLPLRAAIAHYLIQARAVRCDADQIIIVNGIQQALDLVTRVVVDRGDFVAMEDPGWLYARRTFLANGAALYPIPVDQAGMQVERLSNLQAVNLKLVYVTPSHQFPTGAVLSLPRRLELLMWAAQARAIILEDDYDSEFRYAGRPISALQGLDQTHSVIYMGTFSKILFPALRIGYLVVPKSLVHVLASAKQLADRQTPLLEQQVLADFINEGHLERHIRRMRSRYDQRRQALIRALQQYLGKQISIVGENAGLHLMVRLQTSLNPEAIANQAARSGVELISADSYYLRQSDRRCEFIVGYANLSVEQITIGVQRLAQLLIDD